MKRFTAYIFILFFLIGINYSQANLIKDLYNKYTNKIGYEDLIIGESSDTVDRYCSIVVDDWGNYRFGYNEYYRCYDIDIWDFYIDIKQNKISRIRMTSNDNELSYSDLKPIINTLNKKYKLDDDPEVSTNRSGKIADGTITTLYSFGKGSVLLKYTDYSPTPLMFDNLTVITYQPIYSDARF